MLHRSLRVYFLGLSIGMTCLSATGALADDVILMPSKIAGAPDHIIPMSSSQIAEARVHEILSEKLSTTLDIAPPSSSDAKTFADLERITAFADLPDPSLSQDDETADSADELEMATQANQTDQDQMALQASSIDPLKDMNLSDAQMRLFVMLAMAIKDPEKVADLLDETPRNVDRGATEDHAAADASLMLRGWNVRMDGFGDTHLFQENSPNSSIQLEEGIVIGALGSVTEIRKIGGEVHVFFESGDSMSGVVDPEMNGIPPLTEIGERISTKGETSIGEFFSLSQPKELN